MSENQNNQAWNPAQNPEEESGLTIRDLWDLVWNNKWWYVLCVLACLVVAAFYLYRTPKTYSRTEKIIIDSKQQSSIIGNLTESKYLTNMYGNQEVEDEIQAITSPDMMRQVVERLNLQTSYVNNMFLRRRELYTSTPFEIVILGDNAISSSFSFTAQKVGDSTFVFKDFHIKGEKISASPIKGSFKDSLVTPVGSLRVYPTNNLPNWTNDITVTWANSMARAKVFCNNLTASRTNKNGAVVALTMEDAHSSRAINILRTLLDVYNQTWVNNQNRSAKNTSDFINERLLIIEQELGGIENDLKKYKEENQLTDIGSIAEKYLEESSDYAAKSFEVSNQLSIARFIKDYLQDPAHSKDLIPANSGLTNANVESQIQEYNAMLLERDRLVSGSSESNPLVQDMNSSLESLKSAVNRSIDNLISTLQLEANKINDQENQIRGRLTSTTSQEFQLLSIERQQKVSEQLYVFLLQKREENEIASLVNVGNTRLIQEPNGSSAPVAPNKKVIALLALILGLGIPFAFFYLKNVLDTRVHGRTDLSKVTVPFLAEVPQMGLSSNYWQRLKQDRYDNRNTAILVKPGSRDTMNEAYRVLRTNLDMVVGHEEGCHTIMVTSFNPNAGKTFNTLNMAASMALKGSSVLLLDLDLRKATLSKALEKNTSGVAAYLNGKSDTYMDKIQKVQDNLYLLSVGTLPPNPAELLVTKKFTDMIADLEKHYEYIFIDCPPIDIVADTAIIAKVAKMTIFIMRAGLFDKRALGEVEELYKSGKYNRMSIILNGVEAVSGRYGHYGYGKYGYGSYGYGYGYGNSNDEHSTSDESKEA